jgi:HEPN domain-containing protein
MQTSIEWLVEQLLGNGLLRLTKEEHKIYSELRDLAKQINKREIKDAFDEGQEYEYQYHINNVPKFDSETYYQETFKKKIT